MLFEIAFPHIQHSAFSIQHFLIAFPHLQHSAFNIQHFLLAPTQEEVFKSIQSNVDEPSSSGKVLPFLMAGAGVIILLAVFTQRRKREYSPKALNNPGKLLKEVLKVVPMRSAEVKQLKVLAESNRGAVTGPVSPLTLLICPSLFTQSIRNRSVKLDSKALSSLAKRIGVAIEPKNKPAAAKTAKLPATSPTRPAV